MLWHQPMPNKIAFAVYHKTVSIQDYCALVSIGISSVLTL